MSEQDLCMCVYVCNMEIGLWVFVIDSRCRVHLVGGNDRRRCCGQARGGRSGIGPTKQHINTIQFHGSCFNGALLKKKKQKKKNHIYLRISLSKKK